LNLEADSRSDRFFVDIHCHILPGVDDGARNREEAIAMARQAESMGTRSIIATPHHIPRSPLSAVDEVSKRARQLQQVLEWAEVNVEIHPGQENNARRNLIARFDEREAVALNGTRYMLVEPPFRTYPDFLEELLVALIQKGVIPVIAHPERNIHVQRDLQLVSRLVGMGALIQVNTGSLLGSYKQPAMEAATALLRQDLVHVIASDAHSDSGPFVPNMRQGFDVVAAQVGEEKAWVLARDNPLRILTDQPIGAVQPEPVGGIRSKP
jgi:protein-tyrosine phosphatase